MTGSPGLLRQWVLENIEDQLAMLMIGGLRDAVRAPATPPRGWPRPATRRSRRLAAFFWVTVATGLTGGAIPQLIMDMGVAPSLAAVLGLAQCGPLLVAARWPLAAWRVMAAGMLVNLLVGSMFLSGRDSLSWPWPVAAWAAMLVVLFQVRMGHERWTAIGAGAITALAVVLPAVPIAGMPFWFALILCGLGATTIVFADSVSGRYVAEASLAEQAELRRRDLARQAVLEERSRIARELHDVVAHHMSVIALQSEAAPYKIEDLPPAAARTFGVIGDAAREALTETRRMVGLLREDDETAERLPQPGLERLGELAEAARGAGLTVESRITGVPRPLDAGVDVSAYRIVQEALSNAVRHASGARVRITVRYGADRLAVSVTDDGPGGMWARDQAAGARPDPGGGHGLVGMRERVTMLGGTLSAGPRAEGGFAVAAELPYAGGGAAPRGTADEAAE